MTYTTGRKLTNGLPLPSIGEDHILKESVADYIGLIAEHFPCAHNSYRGMRDARYALVPTLGRLSEYRAANEAERLELESLFLSRTFQARLPSGPANFNEIAAAIAAQHHGAPTRLLDWSDSPLIALFFATEARLKSDGTLAPATADAAVWVKHECPDPYDSAGDFVAKSTQADLRECLTFRELEWGSGSCGFAPTVLTPRISSQLGSFTVSPDPATDLREQPSASITKISKITIPMHLIARIQADLFRLGIRKRSIYPDEDGLNSSLVAERQLEGKLEDRCHA